MSRYDDLFDEWWKAQKLSDHPLDHTPVDLARTAYVAGLQAAGTYQLKDGFSKVVFGNGRFVKVGEVGILLVGWEA